MPNQALRSPWILDCRCITEHGLHKLTQTTSGEWKAHQSTNPVDSGQLFTKPSAGWPGVDHHFDLLEGARGGNPEFLGQKLSEQFRSVASVNLQQGTTATSPCLSALDALSVGSPITCTTASVSGQNAVSSPP